MNDGLYTDFDADIANETVNWYYTNEGEPLVLPDPADYEEMPSQTSGLSISLPEGWWIILIIGILINLSINLILNHKK